MAISVGSVSVSIVPDASTFGSVLKGKLIPIGDAIGRDLGKQIGSRIADEVSRSLGDGVRNGSSSAKAQAAKAGEDSGGAFASGFRKRVEAALAALPDAKITADSSEADRKIADLRGQLQTLAGARIGIDIDDARALEELARIKADLDELGAKSPSVQVKADVAAASAQLAIVQAEVDKLAGENPTVKVDVDGAGAVAELEAIGGAANSSSGGMGSLLAAGIALGPALIPVAAAIAAAFAAIGGGIAVGAAAFGVTALGLSGVTGALKAYDTVQAQAGQGAAKLAVQQTQVASAQASLANAEATAADASVRSAEQVSNARRGVADASRQAAQQVQAALDQQATAERTLTDAQRAEKQAQLDLTQARVDAAQKIQDLTLRVQDAALSERDARLAILEAQRNLGKGDALQQARAQLTFDQAKQHLRDLLVDNSRLAAQKTAADKAGVNGSTLVLTAQQRLVAAQQKAADAQRGVARADQAVADARISGAERVAKANQSLADAIRSQAAQQRQSAFSVEQAQRALQQATEQTGTTGSAAMSKLQQALAKLTPEGRKFVAFLRGTLLPQLRGIRGAAQTALLPGLQQGLTSAAPAIPAVQGAVTAVAAATGSQFEAAGRAAGGPFWTSFIKSAGSFLAAGVPIVGNTLGNLLKGLAGLAKDAAPFLLDVGRAVERLSKRFADFGAGAGGQKAVQGFFQYVKDNGPQLQSTLDSIAGALKSLGGGALAIAPTSLSGIKLLADVVAGMSPQQVRDLALAYVAFRGAVAIGGAVSGAASALKTLGAITTGVRAAVIGATLAEDSSTAAMVANKIATVAISAATKVYAGAQFLLNAAMSANPLVLVGLLIAALVVGIVIAYQRSETFRRIVNALWEGLKLGALTAVTFVLKYINFFLGGIELILIALGHLPGRFGAPFREGAKAIQAARDKITSLQAGINALKGKNVPVTVSITGRDVTASKLIASGVDRQTAIGDALHRATGGWVPGYSPGDRSDNIPATIAGKRPLWLTGEEFVIQRPTARTLQKQYPGFLEALNAGQIDVGGDPSGMTARAGKPLAFAGGGSIPSVQSFLRSVDPLPYVWGAVGPHAYDCSGLAGEAFNRLTGRASYHRQFTTSSNFSALGFQRGTGTFTIGVNPGTHMDLNLAGQAAEAQSTATGIKVGAAATPVTRFAQQWYLPQVGGKFIAGGGSAGSAGPSGPPPLTAAQIAQTVRLTEPAIAADIFRELHVGVADTGGVIEPGWNLTYNGLGARETILTPGQMAGLTSRGGDSRNVTYENHFNYTQRPLDPAELTRAQHQAETLAGLS